MREGERPALVDWASAARGRPLQAKLFNDPVEPEVILAPASGLELEVAREHLAPAPQRSLLRPEDPGHQPGAIEGGEPSRCLSGSVGDGMSHQRHASSLAWWALLPLLLQCIALNWTAFLTWPTWALVLCALFKLRECRRPFDRRLVALLQLLSTGLLAAQLQGLLASLLQVLAVFLALAGLLGHELAGVLSFRGFLQRSLQLLAAALPLALVLFLFVPRLPPLWTTELGPSRGAVSGLSPELDPLSIAELALVDVSAARVLLPDGQPLLTDAYWRVLVHEQFDGRRWQHRDPPVPRGGSGESMVGEGTSQWWVVEPSATRAVPWDGSAVPTSPDQGITPEGELLVGAASRQRRSFRLQSTQRAAAWQQRPPIPTERQAPPDSLARLKTLAQQFQELPTGRERLAAVEGWFRGQPFR
ncbi:DUF3488 domain-containing protein [Synechococcus sp. AH-736-M02]|nr:DUF3488 domain-containing protein [Synechococcus sp. AH-736-M02]